MGSKRVMLKNGLGVLLDQHASSARRFVDLFSGSGAVATFIATRFPIPVLAFDLQHFSTVLTAAIISRSEPFDWRKTWQPWHERANRIVRKAAPPEINNINRKAVAESRAWCARQPLAPITTAYGGHYFSPLQAVWIDALRKTLPRLQPVRTVALAALIQAASECAAAPGHTAQPFQPTKTAKQFLRDAWSRDVVQRTQRAFGSMAPEFAKRRGRACILDANQAAASLRAGDLAFIDPPYSGVHYSRFYHVLETISRGRCGVVSGVGRYPSAIQRPRSSYSVKSESRVALERLFSTLAARGAKAILTFPDHACSNGLSGELVRNLATEHFRIEEQSVTSTFSTLGGDNSKDGRAARHHTRELMLLLRPR
jgi:adenine-specific DNA-methyltransferase